MVLFQMAAMVIQTWPTKRRTGETALNTKDVEERSKEWQVMVSC